MLKITAREADNRLSSLCERYWAVKHYRGRRTSFTESVIAIARDAGVTTSDLGAAVAAQSYAIDLARSCSECGRPLLFRSRTEFMESFQSAPKCKACTLPIARANHERWLTSYRRLLEDGKLEKQEGEQMIALCEKTIASIDDQLGEIPNV